MASPLRQARLILPLLILAAAAPALPGCGGGALSMEDMKARAIRRKKDDEEEKQQPATSPAAEQPFVVNTPGRLATTGSPPTPSDSNVAANASTAASPAQEQPVDQTPGDDVRGETERRTAASDVGYSDARAASKRPFSALERARRSGENIQKISNALEAYLKERGKYFGPAIVDSSGRPLLSWRVALLPYLGHADLHQQFQLDEPWFSKANKPLLNEIPSVYQSPERYDEKTNYLAAAGKGAVLSSRRGVHPRRIEDGPENTAFVLEVDDALAVEWTKPEEYQFDVRNRFAELGGLRNRHVLVAWGGGYAGAVPCNLSRQQWKEMFSPDDGGNFSSLGVMLPLDEDAYERIALTSDLRPPVSTPVASSVESNSAEAPHAVAREPGQNITRQANSRAAQEFLTAARRAFELGYAADSLRWYYASNILSSNHGRWHTSYQWSPGLKRPVPTLHFCIGVRGRSTLPPVGSRDPRVRPDAKQRQVVLNLVGPPGVKFLQAVEQHAASLCPAALGSPAEGAHLRQRRRRILQRPPAPVTYLGVGTRSHLTQQAIESCGDVLVLCQVREKGGGHSLLLSIELIDLARGANLLKLPEIAWLNNEAGLAALERDDRYRQSAWKLEDLLADQLVLGQWPDQLKSRHAVARLASLGDAKRINALAALAEMFVYRNRGLVNNKQLLAGVRGVLGDDQGETLLLGDAQPRARTLRPWLPSEKPQRFLRIAEAAAARRQDDDR